MKKPRQSPRLFHFVSSLEFKQIPSSTNRQATEGCTDESFCGLRKQMPLARGASKTFLRVAFATVVLTRGGLCMNSIPPYPSLRGEVDTVQYL